VVAFAGTLRRAWTCSSPVKQVRAYAPVSGDQRMNALTQAPLQGDHTIR